MRAVLFKEHGDRGVLTYVTDYPPPQPKADELLIRVRASGVNQVDLVLRQGYPGLPLPLPHIMGGDIAGVVEEVGSDVTDVSPNSRVVVYPIVSCGQCPLCREGKPNLCVQFRFFGMHMQGGYAEYVAVPADSVLMLPESVPFEQAVSLPVAGLTAFHALKTVGELQAGQTLFIWGGSGGLGTIAIQIAKNLGATVIATAGSDAKLKLMKQLGADVVLNRFSDDIPSRVRQIAPAGVDVILDPVGPQTFPLSFEMLKKGGTMLLLGITTGRETTLSIHMTYLRHLSLKGLYLGSKAEMAELLSWLAAGKIKAYIGKVLPLEQAAEGHRLLEASEAMGKVALTI